MISTKIDRIFAYTNEWNAHTGWFIPFLTLKQPILSHNMARTTLLPVLTGTLSVKIKYSCAIIIIVVQLFQVNIFPTQYSKCVCPSRMTSFEWVWISRYIAIIYTITWFPELYESWKYKPNLSIEVQWTVTCFYHPTKSIFNSLPHYLITIITIFEVGPLIITIHMIHAGQVN